MFKMINRLKNKKGFTLIELIVVLAVLGIIALIAIPRFLTVQETAKEDSDVSSGAMISKAAELYVVQEKYDITSGDLNGSALKGTYVDSALSFQSSDIKTKTLDDVTITFDSGATGDGGVLQVKIGTEIIYPEISHTLGK
jgi:prepilin-type N-terminal cleavage/methylation domain-containing protein